MSHFGDYFTALVTVSVTQTVAMQVRFVAQAISTQSGDTIAAACYEDSTRSGIIHLDGHAIEFRLSGMSHL
jgi:hypothetical protein